ncbi:MAG: hypothetical protein WAT79_02615 [Saprospiraceae bacterium]
MDRFTLMYRFVLLFSLLLFFSSCYKRVEGCLDTFSANFNPNADDPCAACCTNPELKITIKHRLNEAFYSPNDTITNDLNQAYKLLDFGYYLSDIFPVFTTNEILTGINKFEYQYQQQNMEVPDHVTFIRPDVFDYSVNEIRQYGHFHSIQLLVGFENSLSNATSIQVPDTHILSDSLFLRDSIGNKTWGFVKIVKGTEFKDTLTLDFYLNDDSVFLILPKDITNTKGTNLTYTLLADYTNWFNNVDMNHTVSEIKRGVLANLKLAFAVE